MQVGLFTFSTDRDMPPGHLAQEAEARDFAHLMFTEHSHIPASRDTPYPEVYGGGALPDFYQRTYDPFVACSFAAAATTKIEVGTAVCLLALRDPIHAAKEIASVDRLSGGRFVFGVGFGWNADEFVSHNASFGERYAIVEERVQLMRSLWTEDEASFRGQYARLEPCWAWPKPVQRPHPPVLVGGNGPRSMRHAARWGDGWYPTSFSAYPSVADAVSRYRALVEQVGRDPKHAEVGIAAAGVTEAQLAEFQAAGLKRVDLIAMADGDDALLAHLDGLAKLRDTVLT